jgi:hypothetical protein
VLRARYLHRAHTADGLGLHLTSLPFVLAFEGRRGKEEVGMVTTT